MWGTPQPDPHFLIAPDSLSHKLSRVWLSPPRFVIYKALNSKVLLMFPLKGIEGEQSGGQGPM